MSLRCILYAQCFKYLTIIALVYIVSEYYYCHLFNRENLMYMIQADPIRTVRKNTYKKTEKFYPHFLAAATILM